jgi:hypothetical protein
MIQVINHSQSLGLCYNCVRNTAVIDIQILLREFYASKEGPKIVKVKEDKNVIN